MGGRITAIVVAALCLGARTSADAQAPPPYPAPPGAGWQSPPGASTAGDSPGLLNTLFDPRTRWKKAEPPADKRSAVVPAGYVSPPPGAMPPPLTGPADYGYAQCSDGCRDPEPRCWNPFEHVWHCDKSLRDVLRSATRNHTFSAEFLLWELEQPGDTLLGENMQSIADPTQPFELVDPLTEAVLGTTRVPTLGTVFYRDIYGVRLTYGVPLVFGSFELSGFALDEAHNILQLDPDTQGTDFLSNSTLLNGEISNSNQRLDDFYAVTTTSRLWSVEAKTVWDNGAPVMPFERIPLEVSFAPMLVLNYSVLQESMDQFGIFSESGQRSRVINNVTNNFVGAGPGIRLEAKLHRLTFGFEPRITVGPNILRVKTGTNQFASIADGERLVTSDFVEFSPMVQVGAYARGRVTDNITLMVGYNLLYFINAQRAAKGVQWDVDPVITGPFSLVRPEEDTQDFLVEGLSVGLEIKLP